MKKLLQRGVGTFSEACGARFNTSRPRGGVEPHGRLIVYNFFIHPLRRA